MDIDSRVIERTHAFEMRCYRRLLNISYKDHVTNKEGRRKILEAIGESDELLTMFKMVWPYLKVFWLSKDNPTEKIEEVDSRKGGKTI